MTRTIDYTNVLIADGVIVLLLLISAVIFKTQRTGLIACGLLYGFFTYAWHFGFGLGQWLR